jgi:hypothetical protein
MTRPESRIPTMPDRYAPVNLSKAINLLEDAQRETEKALKRYRIEHTDGDVSYIYSKDLHRQIDPPKAYDWSGVIIAGVLLASCFAYTVWRVL